MGSVEGDSLNHRPHLYETLADLQPVVASADARPTEQSYAVFDKLSGGIDEQLAALDELVRDDLAGLNARLHELGVDAIGA